MARHFYLSPRLVIAPPFGNYLFHPELFSVLGTYTLQRRPGRLWRILRTLRPHWRLKAWTNSIGLRNPGILSLPRHGPKARRVQTNILSIHGFHVAEWRSLAMHAAELHPKLLELNISCPNVVAGNGNDWDLSAIRDGIGAANESAKENLLGRVIVKLPPAGYSALARRSIDILGEYLWGFHCCNTLPTPMGGMSGKPLKAFSLAATQELRKRYSHLAIVGGGGVTSPKDVGDFLNAGADWVSVGTYLFGPWRLRQLVRWQEQAQLAFRRRHDGFEER